MTAYANGATCFDTKRVAPLGRSIGSAATEWLTFDHQPLVESRNILREAKSWLSQYFQEWVPTFGKSK
ncbi:hypothetical protein GCM10011588_45060 [Nocardia jinanensis]|uniref:Uncharacterized protein n=1 Tax=Nocardia jinanensis TaxID=382504 RepID=A0A917RSQ6_9NOCA|nr:hypothetical protein GCM10011588_45060 [Nocardia jinanensis]